MRYYGYRYYNATHGRFINRGPIGESGGNNLYAFTGNDPVNRWDVLGLCVFSDGNWWGCVPGDMWYPPSMWPTWSTYNISPPRIWTTGTFDRPNVAFNDAWQRDWRKRDMIYAAQGANATPASESGGGRISKRIRPSISEATAAGIAAGIAVPIDGLLGPAGESLGKGVVRVGMRVLIRTAAGTLQGAVVVAVVGNTAIVSIVAPLVLAPVTTNNPIIGAVRDIGRPQIAYPLGHSYSRDRERSDPKPCRLMWVAETACVYECPDPDGTPKKKRVMVAKPAGVPCVRFPNWEDLDGIMDSWDSPN